MFLLKFFGRCPRQKALKLFNGTAKRNMACLASDTNIVWIDLEMTGLDVETSHILEVACLITDKELNVICNGFSAVIHQPDSILDSMNGWCRKQHKETGLTEDCRKSKTELKEAEQMLLKHIKAYAPERKCPLAGNSVYMDRLFLIKYMPILHEYLHYRIIDVSTIKELARRWKPNIYNDSKNSEHRALADIKDSINELKYYKEFMFIE